MFSEELHRQSAIYEKRFLEHPFLKELSKGKLPIEKFTFYIEQDNIFLRDMNYARRVLASKDSAGAEKLSSLISSVYRHELRARRDIVAKNLKLKRNVESAPTTLAYTSYLIRLAYQAIFEEAFAALISCPRLYTMIGEKYASCPAISHPVYGRWLAIYTSKEMGKWTDQLLEMLDSLAEKKPYMKKAMAKSYINACRYEIKFFDMAYNMEGWD